MLLMHFPTPTIYSGVPLSVNSTIPLSCPNTSFACADGSGCVPGFEFCNAKPACPDGSDETAGVCGPVGRFAKRLLLGHPRQSSRDCPFRCADGGRCRAVDTVCSGKDGCGDGSDERMCQICSKCLRVFCQKIKLSCSNPCLAECPVV